MIGIEEFREEAHKFVDWMADYLKDIEKLPVKSQVQPREIYDQLPEHPPEESEPIQAIMQDFEKIILPGITHWQSPRFFAYFPANASYPSVLAEMLTAALAAQCMIWDTSPSAAELEEKVLNWLKQMTGLPEKWEGVIQDSASSATLVSLLTAREKYSQFGVNEKGFADFSGFRIYCSVETHSSVEKAAMIAGFGRQNLVKVAVDEDLRLNPKALREAVEKDRKDGKKPVAVVATLGTTGTTAIDPLKEIAAICAEYDLWLHVDAAFAGTALVLPEYRWMTEGIEQVDTFVFNPHKWMFTNFDCSAYYVKDRDALLRTMSILPEYLKTSTTGKVNDYRDWGIPLGRRFRALKLWFVIRNFGVKGIRERLRSHLQWAKELEQEIRNQPDFEIMAPRTVNLVCFRYRPPKINDEKKLDQLNEKLLRKLNESGKLFLTHTRVKGKYTLRLVTGQTYLQKRHVTEAWNFILQTARSI
ncbi:MAG: aminotransferase class V-fold PLP-dependent enzyme [Calditrichaeota bacterium]|nr:aminotransferase class V-fold PLP-dependent enzyme [Calditrichota bacterium]